MKLRALSKMKLKNKTLSPKLKAPSRIMGIDPGYGRLGIAVIEIVNNKISLIHSECFETSKNLPHDQRLGAILNRIKDTEKKYKPELISIETLIFSKNVKTALKVAEVRGVIIAFASSENISVLEYHPNTIKIAVTGYGKSDKRQMIFMVRKILNIKKEIKHDDEYDAIATALTCGVSHKFRI